jgi:anti-sigma B factor antagonist
MECEIRQVGNVFVVKPLEKQLIAGMTETFKKKLTQLIAEGHTCIVVDLSAVDHIDSSGISAMIYGLNLIWQDGHVAIAGANKSILHVLHLTRIDCLFQIFDDVNEAVSALSGSQA